MSALNLENSRTKVYGWVAGSFNFSTSAKNNFLVSYEPATRLQKYVNAGHNPPVAAGQWKKH